MKSDMVGDFRKKGLSALADIMDAATLRNFAAWGWGTLASICRNMDDWVRSFARHFSPDPFKKAKEQERLKKVCLTCQPKWLLEFGFIAWFVSRIDLLQQRGGTCECHRQEYDRGEAGSSIMLLPAHILFHVGYRVYQIWNTGKFMGF